MKDQSYPTIVLTRFEQNEKGTLGKLISKFIELCYTLEPAWHDNRRDNPNTKQNEASCIPEGKYLCMKYSSEKFPDTWEITGIPGRSEVLFHSGVYPDNSKGCIMVGVSHGESQGIPFINNGKRAMDKLRNALPHNFWLEVKCDGFRNSLCDFDPKSFSTKEECQHVINEKNVQRNQKSL